MGAATPAPSPKSDEAKVQERGSDSQASRPQANRPGERGAIRKSEAAARWTASIVESCVTRRLKA